MTADVELLPLPAIDAIVKYVEDYASANVAHATAAKDAEIEALRAERDLFRDETIELVRQNGEWQARSERLAEALRGAEKSLRTIADGAGRADFLEDSGEVRGYANSRANAARVALDATALHPTAAQEDRDE